MTYEQILTQMFIRVLNLSLMGAFVILAVLAARLALRKAPRRYSLWLWAVVFFRLACPFTLESALALLPVRADPIPQTIEYQMQPTIYTGVAAVDGAVNSVLPAATPWSSVNPLQVWLILGAYLWALVLAVLLVWSGASALRLALRLRGAAEAEPGVYEAEGLQTPFVFGRRIYLPAHLAGQERAYILEHERTHLRCHHPAAKAAAFLIACVHWFDPLVWVAFRRMVQDMEMACDEQVLARMGSGIKKDYCTSLLGMAVGRGLGGTPLAFGEGGVKGRVKHVLAYKKPAAWVSGLAAVLAVTLCVGLAFSRAGEEAPQGTDAPQPPVSTPAPTPGTAGQQPAVTPAPTPGGGDAGAAVAPGEPGMALYEVGQFLTAEGDRWVLTMPLINGWSVQPVAYNLPAVPAGSPEPATPEGSLAQLRNAAGETVGTVCWGSFDPGQYGDVPEADRWKAALAPLRLSSAVQWCNGYTVVKQDADEGIECAVGTTYVNDYYLYPDRYTAAAQGQILEYPSLTAFRWEDGVYVGVAFGEGERVFDEEGFTPDEAVRRMAQG
ncbi:MAG: hypothetical protein IJ484_02615, partial [Oscillospiraceae bacterium]|nr:hypothetical protein [Oscillospiraceae bacterium]